MGVSRNQPGRSPLTLQLWSILGSASIGLCLLLATVVTDQRRQDARAASAASQRRACEVLARRAGPLLDSGDQPRLAALAASVADVTGSRIVLLDADGRVLLDTGLRLVGQSLAIETADGILARSIDRHDREFEVLAPVLATAGLVGEVRLRYRVEPELSVGFAWEMFGTALLCCLSLAVLAWWILHHWVLQLRSAAVHVRSIGTDCAQAELDLAPQRQLRALGDLGSAVLETVARVDEERRRCAEASLELAQRLVRSLEQRGLTPVGHGDRTKTYALLLAEAAGVPEHELPDVAMAASLVDLGKAAVRASALTKRDELSSVERESLRHAPIRAASFLHGVPATTEIARMLRHHHEKYDGTGYPDGLRGERIPLGGRILAIADAYDLLTCDSPGHQALAWPDALDRLHDDRGEHFDPGLLDLFEDAIRSSPVPRTVRGPVILEREAEHAALPYKLAEDAPAERRRDDAAFDLSEAAIDAVVAQFQNMEFEVLADEPDYRDDADGDDERG